MLYVAAIIMLIHTFSFVHKHIILSLNSTCSCARDKATCEINTSSNVNAIQLAYGQLNNNMKSKRYFKLATTRHHIIITIGVILIKLSGLRLLIVAS